jgi:hypothetical protein
LLFLSTHFDSGVWVCTFSTNPAALSHFLHWPKALRCGRHTLHDCRTVVPTDSYSRAKWSVVPGPRDQILATPSILRAVVPSTKYPLRLKF